MAFRLFFLVVLLLAKSAVAQRAVPFEWASTQDSLRPTSSAYSHAPPPSPQKHLYYWLRFKLSNPDGFDQTFVLYSTSKWGRAYLYAATPGPLIDSVLRSGGLLPLSERSFRRSATAFKVMLRAGQTLYFEMRLHGALSIYTPKKLDLQASTSEHYEEQDKRRFWLQALFMGIIVIMALYNLVIYLSVHDISYLYYVVSILGIGLYFFFYYGFGLELLWQNAPHWEAYAFAFIVPSTNLARIYFTKSYLHLHDTSPLLNRGLNIFSAFCILIMLMGAGCYAARIDLLVLLIDLISLLGTTVLSMMLLCGIIVYRRGYAPALYFSLANLILVLGGILFIFRELSWIPDNALTRYTVQYGVIAQVILFSLGLSNRLNQAQLKVAQLELDQERERKRLLEEQSQLLQQQVAEQTAHLTELNHLKDRLLSIISHDLRNPLVSLDSFLNLLLNHHNRLSEQEQITLAQKAKQSLSNLNQLLTNLLLWSRSQMSQVSFAPQWTDVGPLVANNLTLLSLDIELKNLQVVLRIPAEAKLYADTEMLDFIVRNLLSNAIKFSNRNGQIRVEFAESAGACVLSVSDDGVGMTAEQIRRVYSQTTLPSTRGTAKEKGSGLGLVICREFMDLHHGQLRIESQQGTSVSCLFGQPTEPPNTF